DRLVVEIDAAAAVFDPELADPGAGQQQRRTRRHAVFAQVRVDVDGEALRHLDLRRRVQVSRRHRLAVDIDTRLVVHVIRRDVLYQQGAVTVGDADRLRQGRHRNKGGHANQ